MTNTQRKAIDFPSDEEEARIQAGITQDPDNPELTDEELASMRPAREVLSPALFAALTSPPVAPAETDPKHRHRYHGLIAAILRNAKTGRFERGDRPASPKRSDKQRSR